METSGPPSVPPVQPGSPSPVPPKKGLGTGAKIGIGCGVIVLLGIIGAIVAAVLLGGKVKEFAENPTRATANLMVSTSGGAMEIVAQDEANKRYTIREKKSGALTTVYWNEKKNAPEVIPGDFSAIPAEPAPVPEAGQH